MFVGFRLKLPSNLRRRKSAALGPQRLTRLASGGNRCRVASILASADVAQVSGAVATNFVWCGDDFEAVDLGCAGDVVRCHGPNYTQQNALG